ncbi:MAG: hypothetical protein O2963_00150 [Proteobacteria bacterium]|nr:hypothetical protein [Pseudomonadota bacterium]
MTIQRNLDGFSTREASDPLGLLPFPDPTKVVSFFDDFIAYDDTQATGDPWTFTQTNGTDAVAGPNGTVTLTLGGADNDLVQLQLKNAAFQTNGKRLWFKTRVKIVLALPGNMDNYEMLFGLTSDQQGAGFIDAGGTAFAYDDGIAFRSIDGTSELTCAMGENDIESTEANVFDVLDDTWMELAIFYNGSQAKFYKDDVLVSTISSSDATSILTPTLYLKAGEAKATVLHCDYVFVAQER